MADLRARYGEIFAKCARTPGGFEHEPDRRGFYEVSREERVALWDRLYDSPGFAIWLRNFREIFTDEKANAEFSEYVAYRIRRRVKDPAIAEKLIPRDHGFGVQRVPMGLTTSKSTIATTCAWSISARRPSSGSLKPGFAPPTATTI